jgi:putative spermidine/putrescine transport system permease protein
MLQPYSSTAERIWYYAHRVLSGAVLLFLILPILVIMPLSFSSGSFLTYPLPGYSTRWYEAFLSSDKWSDAFYNSFTIAPAAALLAIVLGTLAALGLTRKEFPFRGLVMGILISPMVVPIVIVAVGMYFSFSSLGLANSYIGLVLAHAALGVPFVIITVTATLQGFDYNLVRAAASLGANPVTSFFKVTLPLIAPGVLSGGLFAFATSFDEVVVVLFLASPEQRTLPMQMFSGIRENIDPTIAAAATIMIVISVIMLLTLEFLRRRAEKRQGISR